MYKNPLARNCSWCTAVPHQTCDKVIKVILEKGCLPGICRTVLTRYLVFPFWGSFFWILMDRRPKEKVKSIQSNQNHKKNIGPSTIPRDEFEHKRVHTAPSHHPPGPSAHPRKVRLSADVKILSLRKTSCSHTSDPYFLVCKILGINRGVFY